MTSAWGDSWGDSWNGSWGDITPPGGSNPPRSGFIANMGRMMIRGSMIIPFMMVFFQ